MAELTTTVSVYKGLSLSCTTLTVLDLVDYDAFPIPQRHERSHVYMPADVSVLCSTECHGG